MATHSHDPLFHLTRHGGAITARVVCPTLAEAEAVVLDRELTALLEGWDQPVVTLDLAAVRFLGSMAVGRLVGLSHAVRAAGGRLTLVNLTTDLRRVFAVCRLVEMFHLEADSASPPRDAVRARAYRRWEEAGRPGGDGYWSAAERELRGVV